MFNKELFLQLCEEHGVEFSDKYSTPMIVDKNGDVKELTVKELIELLSKMPQDAVVEVPDWYSDTCIAAEDVGEGESEYYGKVVKIMS